MKQSASSVTGDVRCGCLSVRRLSNGGRKRDGARIVSNRRSAGVPVIVRCGDGLRGLRLADDDLRAVYFRARSDLSSV